ncbi:MAG: Chemotaxis protein methyltransferase CheR [Chthoniobacteraceae bacterium]|nr:Chemotaxis protein methyltransferase CheR [Chthoniobacteraceae bacterium]
MKPHSLVEPQHLRDFFAYVAAARKWARIYSELRAEPDIRCLREAFPDDSDEPARFVEGQTFADVAPRTAEQLALERSEARLRRVFESNVVGMIRWDLDRSLILDANEEFLRMTGYTRDDIAAGVVNFRTLTPAEWTPRNEDGIRALREHGFAPAYEKEYFRKDGSRIPLIIAGTRFNDSPSEGMSFLIDISSRKRAEAAARQNAVLFSTLIEQAPMGVYVVDAQFRLQQVNTEAMPTFANVDPLIGRDFNEVMQIIWGPEIGRQCAAIFRHTLATGERYISPPFAEQRHDLGEEGAYEWQTQRVTLPDGQHGVVCYFHEVTASARSEAALRASEERTRLATSATGVGIWEWNVLTNKIRWDAEMFQIYGVTPTPDGIVPYATWSQAVVPEDLPQREAILQELARVGGQTSREFRIRRANDGQCRHIRSVETVRANAHGRPERVVGTNLDITESKQTEAALRDAKEAAEIANHSKDRFLAVLSHELRTPLTPVLMTAAAYRSDERIPPEIRDEFRMIERNISLEARLIDDLLDLTRIVNGKLTVRVEPCDAHSLLGLVVDMVRGDAQAKQIAIHLELTAERSHLTGDPARLQQVFWNLLRNAVKFTPVGGRVDIRSFDGVDATDTANESRVCIEVGDNGIGFEPAAAACIFEPFEQDRSGQRFGGLGLGLAIARAIVDIHHGAIRAESPGPGQGAKFTVELPGTIDTDGQVAASTRESSQGHVDSEREISLRLLLVEDHAPTLQVLTRLLSRAGHQIVTAQNIAEGRAAAASASFDLVISDLGLPDGTGIELMKSLRASYGLRGIALTGYGADEDVRRSAEAGFIAHLVKPVQIDELRRLLRELAVPNA